MSIFLTEYLLQFSTRSETIYEMTKNSLQNQINLHLLDMQFVLSNYCLIVNLKIVSLRAVVSDGKFFRTVDLIIVSSLG